MCVAMPVVQVRVVRMLVPHRLVPMRVRMLLADRVLGRMLVLMMLVMGVAMCMLQRVVDMFVLVPLREMKIKTDTHQGRRGSQLAGKRLAE